MKDPAHTIVQELNLSNSSAKEMGVKDSAFLLNLPGTLWVT